MVEPFGVPIIMDVPVVPVVPVVVVAVVVLGFAVDAEDSGSVADSDSDGGTEGV